MTQSTGDNKSHCGVFCLCFEREVMWGDVLSARFEMKAGKNNGE